MKPKISEAFMTFNKEAPEHAKSWSEMVAGISRASVLDPKSTALIYIAVLAALGMENGIPFHVCLAKQSGASKEEIVHAVLLGLPPAGQRVTQVLPLVVESYENEQ